MNGTESETTEAPTQHFNAVLWLLLIFAVGWIIYEVTHSPAWAAMAMCLKFGLEDFRTAWWLLRTDPDRGRGRAGCWLHIASGLWQVAIIGVAMVLLTVVLVYVMEAKQGNAQGVLFLLHGAAMAIVLGFILSTIATYIAMLNAWRHHARPWLNGAIHIARRKGEWPPLYGHQNRVLVLAITTALVTCLVLIPTILVLLTAVFRKAMPRKTADLLVGLGVFFSVFVLLPIFGYIIRKLRQQRFFASHPADCWGDGPIVKLTPSTHDAESW